jgi:hypothetical protein
MDRYDHEKEITDIFTTYPGGLKIRYLTSFMVNGTNANDMYDSYVFETEKQSNDHEQTDL